MVCSHTMLQSPSSSLFQSECDPCGYVPMTDSAHVSSLIKYKWHKSKSTSQLVVREKDRMPLRKASLYRYRSLMQVSIVPEFICLGGIWLRPCAPSAQIRAPVLMCAEFSFSNIPVQNTWRRKAVFWFSFFKMNLVLSICLLPLTCPQGFLPLPRSLLFYFPNERSCWVKNCINIYKYR